MSDFITNFERRCKSAGVAPTAALKAGGVHPSLWKKWTDGRFTPSLRSFERAEKGLALLAPRPDVIFPLSSPIVGAPALFMGAPSHNAVQQNTRIDGAFSGQPAGELAVAV